MSILKKLMSATLAILTLCSMLAVAAPSAAALEGASKGGSGKIVAWGCDMSQWNVNGATYTDYSLVDFKKMKADGCEYVILRIGDEKKGYGARKADPTFPTLYKMAREAGMHVGAYYYSYKTTRAGAVGDAQFCLDIIEANNMYFEYPIYFDVEADVQQSLSKSAKVDLCLGWCETMEAAGYFPGVYSTAAHSLDTLQSSDKFNYDTWVAIVKKNGTGSQYNPNTEKTSYRTTYGMWQYKWYSSSMSAPSYDGSYWKTSDGWPLDCNVAFKDYPSIMQTYGYNNVVTKHTISFESNGGSAVSAVKVADGEKLTKPADPTKYGFTFGGWYCNPELTDPYDFNTTVPYDFTLYAKWNEANWDIQNNLMPNSSQLQLNSFNSADEKIWPYWNNDSYNSVTLYNGVTDGWSWPSAYMSYQNSFDAVNSGYVYVKKEGNAQFNVTIAYLDKNGEEHEVNLTQAAGSNEADLPAGDLEEFYDVGSYIRNLGHAPASGKVKFTKVTYFVIGEKDSYVKLCDLKFTSKFAIAESYKTMMSEDVTQLSGSGNYVYDNGKLTMNATSNDGYSIKMNLDGSIDPSVMTKLLMDVNSTAPFNVSVELTNGNGGALMNFKSEYFNVFGLESEPAALPAGDWNVNMNLIGYYEWNGGVVAESAIKSVTVTLTAPGTLTMSALQAARTDSVNYVEDGAYSDGSLVDTPDSMLGDVNGDGSITTMDARVVISFLIGGGSLTADQKVAADYDKNGSLSTADVRDMLFAVLTK